MKRGVFGEVDVITMSHIFKELKKLLNLLWIVKISFTSVLP